MTKEEKDKVYSGMQEYNLEYISANPKQTHGVPALLSFLIPGLGQIIKGDILKGIAFFFGTMIGFAFFFIPGLIIWIWNIKDAYDGN